MSTAVLIPAYDPDLRLLALVRDLRQTRQFCEIIVVDDGSQADREPIFRQLAVMPGVTVLRHAINLGKGAALKSGLNYFCWALPACQGVVTADADGQHLPGEIEALVRPVAQGELDFVIGSRILGRNESANRLRYAGIHVFNTLIRLLTPVEITDCSNGFRALRASALRRVVLRQDQFHTAELIIDAAKKGIRIGEAPVTVRRRLSGESKKGGDWRYALSFARTILKTWWR